MPTPIPTTTIQSASLYFREGGSDKEYHAAIEPSGDGFIVIVGVNAYIKPDR